MFADVCDQLLASQPNANREEDAVSALSMRDDVLASFVILQQGHLQTRCERVIRRKFYLLKDSHKIDAIACGLGFCNIWLQSCPSQSVVDFQTLQISHLSWSVWGTTWKGQKSTLKEAWVETRSWSSSLTAILRKKIGKCRCLLGFDTLVLSSNSEEKLTQSQTSLASLSCWPKPQSCG